MTKTTMTFKCLCFKSKKKIMKHIIQNDSFTEGLHFASETAMS